MKRIDFENGTVTENILSAALPMLAAREFDTLKSKKYHKALK